VAQLLSVDSEARPWALRWVVFEARQLAGSEAPRWADLGVLPLAGLEAHRLVDLGALLESEHSHPLREALPGL